MKKRVLKILSLLLAISMLMLSACGTATEKTDETTAAGSDEAPKADSVTYTDAPGSIKKTETVYVNSNYYGTPDSVIVSDWLHTDKAGVKVEDLSDLTNIENSKGDEEPLIDGKSITWHMGTTDLYYRGTTDKELPVSLSIKYFLDDKEVAVEDLAGQSGNVKIKIHIDNNISTVKKIGNKSVTVYNPILVVGGMILTESQFTNITVENGQSIGDGTKQIVVLASMPGLSDTLGLSDFNIADNAIKFPTDFTISMEATNFTLGNLYFAALPFSDLNENFTVPDSVNDLQSSISEISGIVDSVYSMDPEKLIKMLQDNKSGLNELTGAISDAAKLYEENKELIAVLRKYLTEENVTALEKLVSDLDNADLQKYQELLSNPLFKSFFKDLPTIASDLETLMPVITALDTDLSNPEVKASLEKLPETLDTLSGIIDTVEDNQELIDALLDLMSEDNMAKISKIIKAVETANLTDMIDDYTALADNAEEVLARLQAMLDFGAKQKIFTLAAKGTETSTMFVFRTPGITKATVSEDTTKDAGLSTEKEDTGLWATVKGWFSKD